MWEVFAEAIMAEGWRLWDQLRGPQAEVLMLVAGQEAKFIEAILKLIYRRDALLDDRAKTYEMAGEQAAGVGTAIWVAKSRMAESVAAAESKITAKNELEPKIAAAKSAGQAAVASELTVELTGRITAALVQGQDEAIGHAAYGAGEITSHEAKITGWPAPEITDTAGSSNAATPLSTGTGTGGAPTAPASGGSGAQAAGYDTWKDSPTTDRPPENAAVSSGAEDASNQTMSPGDRNPLKVESAAATSSNGNAAPSPGASAAAPPVASAPSPGGSSMGGMGGGPSSVLGSVMQPMQGMASPASSSPGGAGSSGGMPGVGAASAGSPSSGGVAAGAGAAAAGVGGVSAAGLGAGVAESSARMGTGAVSATVNALGAARNVGSQVAQGTAVAAAQAAPSATSGAPASMGAAMMPPPAAAVSPG
jgi:hypothetical protein